MRQISELTEEDLDSWVAIAQGWVIRNIAGENHWADENYVQANRTDYHPSAQWKQAGELIEKFNINLEAPDILHLEIEWEASIFNPHLHMGNGTTPHIAICRAVVSSVYGEEVDDA